MSVDDKNVQDLMKKLVQRSKTLRPFFVVAKTVLDRSTMKTFREQGRPVKWTQLAPFTVASRSAEGTMKGSPILQRYGTLRQSIGTEVLEIGQNYMMYGTKQVKAAMLQFGGTIRPKHGKYLALPFPRVSGRPRDYENTFVPKGKRVIFQNLGGGKIRPLFLLKSSVTIPPRPYLVFQEEDIVELATYLAVFCSDPKAYLKLGE